MYGDEVHVFFLSIREWMSHAQESDGGAYREDMVCLPWLLPALGEHPQLCQPERVCERGGRLSEQRLSGPTIPSSWAGLRLDLICRQWKTASSPFTPNLSRAIE